MTKDILYPLRRLHGTLHESRKERMAVKDLCETIGSMTPHTLLYVLTPTHGNMGDHAITKAAQQLFAQEDIPYLEITFANLCLLRKYHKLGTINRHPIAVNGGGNIGTLWPSVEAVFRQLIQDNPDSSIICLPNTCYFEPSEDGACELELSRKIYGKHPRLLLCAREQVSFDMMEKNFKNVVLIPDMALYLNESKAQSQRSGCMLVLRSDIEKTLQEDETRSIKEQVQTIFGESVFESDMNIGRPVLPENRLEELEKKFSEFQRVQLVVTDRLHGMIFSAITGTPCIVVASKSHKVKGCYDWVRELGYIRFAERVEDIAGIYGSMPKGSFSYDNRHLLPYYDQLKNLIMNVLK